MRQIQEKCDMRSVSSLHEHEQVADIEAEKGDGILLVHVRFAVIQWMRSARYCGWDADV